MPHDQQPSGLQLSDEPVGEVEIFEASQIPTLVVKVHGHPADRMPEVFDAVFRAIFPAMGRHGLTPAGPAFSLHHRMPGETADFEVGLPLSSPAAAVIDAAGDLRFEPSWLPGGRVARISHLGGYEQLGAAWTGFLGAVSAAGATPELPFWEVYATEPRPGMDPAELRTDLFTRVG